MKSVQQTFYDIAYVGDFRASRGGVVVVAEEIAAHATAGYSTALVQVSDGKPGSDPAAHPAIRTCIKNGWATIIGPDGTGVGAGLALLHERLCPDFRAAPNIGLGVERAVYVSHWPVYDSDGEARIDLNDELEAAAAYLGCSVNWAPAWPSVRQHVRSGQLPALTLGIDWQPVTDPARWFHHREAPRGVVPVIGRHSHPERHLWPERLADLTKVYPVTDHFEVRLSGAAGRLLRNFSGRPPSNWRLYDHGWAAAQRFLREIDFFAYSHSSNWPHAIDDRILEALASGAVVVLPKSMAPEFGDAAVYAEPGEAALSSITWLHRNPGEFHNQVARCGAVLAERYGPDVHRDRIRSLIGRPRGKSSWWRFPAAKNNAASGAPAPPRKSAKTVLFNATNGIGIGHLVQLLSIARRLPSDVRPVFATNSQAISIVRNAGYVAHYIPDDRYSETRPRDWNHWLEYELSELIDYYDARAMTFSGVWCFDGILRAGARRPDLPMIWVRIPMWKRPVWDASVDRAKYFDMVLDTGEIAQPRNIGAPIPYADKVELIPPLLFCDSDELLDRDEARQRLGLNKDDVAVLLQLGAGNNIALGPVVEHIISTLDRLDAVQIVVAEWLIAEHAMDSWPNVTLLRDFPNAPYLPAFDFVISASGYNTFHELVAYGIPTVFVPSENQQTDDQLGRAQFAEQEGLGYCVRVSELDRFDEVMPQILRPEVRDRLSSACRERYTQNGAAVAAERIAGFVRNGVRKAPPAQRPDNDFSIMETVNG